MRRTYRTCSPRLQTSTGSPFVIAPAGLLAVMLSGCGQAEAPLKQARATFAGQDALLRNGNTTRSSFDDAREQFLPALYVGWFRLREPTAGERQDARHDAPA